MKIKRREGESASAFLYRFNKKLQQSGILREARKRRFKNRASSKLKKRLSALHRYRKKQEVEKAKKLGTL